MTLLIANHALRLAIAGMFVFYPSLVCAEDYSFARLSDLPGGGIGSRPYDISPNGMHIVGVSTVGQRPGNNAPLTQEAAYWSNGRVTGIADLPGGTSFGGAYGVSQDGSVIVGTGSTASGSIAFRWTASHGMAGLGDLPGGIRNSIATGVSDDGAVVVGSGNSVSGPEAFHWTRNTGFRGLGDLDGGEFESSAAAVSGDGTVVVGTSNSASGPEAYRWTSDSGMIGLGDLEGGDFRGNDFNSQANSVSSNGSVVVGRALGANGFEPFRWTEENGLIGLGNLSHRNTGFGEALGTSRNGAVVVGRTGFSSRLEDESAFIWDELNGMQNLQDFLNHRLGLGSSLAGWRLRSATAISDDGRVITGYGSSPSGRTEAWVAVVPEPSAKLLTLLGCAVISTVRRSTRGRLGVSR